MGAEWKEWKECKECKSLRALTSLTAGFSVLPKAEHRRECGYLCDGSGETVEIGWNLSNPMAGAWMSFSTKSRAKLLRLLSSPWEHIWNSHLLIFLCYQCYQCYQPSRHLKNLPKDQANGLRRSLWTSSRIPRSIFSWFIGSSVHLFLFFDTSMIHHCAGWCSVQRCISRTMDHGLLKWPNQTTSYAPLVCTAKH